MTKQDDIKRAPAHFGEVGLENYAPYLMNRIMGRYNASLCKEMAEIGLTTPQMRTLAILSEVDGILIRELAVYAVVQQSTLSRALEPLVRDNLIRREIDAEDSRAVRLYLTAQGRATYERLWPHMVASNEAMFKGIPNDEKRAFTATLQTMLRNIRKHDF